MGESAFICEKLLKQLENEFQIAQQGYSVLVTSLFDAQVVQLRSGVAENAELSCGAQYTVAGPQEVEGLEFDVVVLSATRTAQTQNTRLFDAQNVYSVLAKAQKLVVAVGSLECLMQSQTWRLIVEQLLQKNCICDAW